MYQWYQDAQVCYAYLGDVRRGERLNDALRQSEWFTRGWTLQELLAPSTVIFFTQDWYDIGSKGSLEEVISEITGIHDFVNFKTACVAQKMSWAAKRKATRVEDMAYCLLGLFDVNMPPLYGEGEKAFLRLQLEILKTSDDESIFAWVDDDPNRLGGLLASSPNQFKQSGNVRPLDGKYPIYDVFERRNQPFSMTNKGLHISLLLIPGSHDSGMVFLGKDSGERDDQFIAPLKCSWHDESAKSYLCPAIPLERNLVNGMETYSKLLYSRFVFLEFDEIEYHLQLKRGPTHEYIYVQEHRNEPRLVLVDPSEFSLYQSPKEWLFSISSPSLTAHDYVVSKYYPLDRNCSWDDSIQNEISLTASYMKGIAAGIEFANSKIRESIFLVLIGDFWSPPWLLVVTTEAGTGLEKITRYLAELYIRAGCRADDYSTSTNNDGNIVLHVRSESEESLMASGPNSEKRPPLDRISRQLRNGKSVSACLRHVKAKGGERRFLIDIGIDLRGGLQWPAPAWVDTLLASLGTNDKNLKEHGSRRGWEERRESVKPLRAAPEVLSLYPHLKKREKNVRKPERLSRDRSRELSKGRQMMESQQDATSSREATPKHRQPESQFCSREAEREYPRRNKRGPDVEGVVHSGVRPGKSRITETGRAQSNEDSRDRRNIGRKER
jgi:hypothetical protein